MFEHNDIFEIDGEHYQIIEIFTDTDDFEDYTLSSLHTPSNTKTLSQSELQNQSRVTDPDYMDYVVHHTKKCYEFTCVAKKARNRGNISEFEESLMKANQHRKKFSELTRHIGD